MPTRVRDLAVRLGAVFTVTRLTLHRYAQFCLVGTTGVAVDIGILYLLLGLHPSVFWLNASKLIAAEAAIVNNFTLNEAWTFGNVAFKAKTTTGYIWRFLKFNGISATGILLTTALLNAQVFLFQMNVYLSNLIAIVIVSIWNYGWSARVGWKVDRPNAVT